MEMAVMVDSTWCLHKLWPGILGNLPVTRGGPERPMLASFFISFRTSSCLFFYLSFFLGGEASLTWNVKRSKYCPILCVYGCWQESTLYIFYMARGTTSLPDARDIRLSFKNLESMAEALFQLRPFTETPLHSPGSARGQVCHMEVA